MKLFASFALVVLLSSTAFATSPTGLYDVIFGAATTSLSVKATNVRTQSMTIQILNDKEEYIVNEKFTNKADFVKKYDLVNLKDGDYQLIINKYNCRITQPFSIDGGYVQLSELEKQTTFFPVILMRDRHFDVNVLSEKYGDIVVNILNEENTTVFSNTISEVFKLHKRFYTKDLPHGTYRVQVIVNGEAYYYDLKK
jgi:hypothetical protein